MEKLSSKRSAKPASTRAATLSAPGVAGLSSVGIRIETCRRRQVSLGFHAEAEACVRASKGEGLMDLSPLRGLPDLVGELARVAAVATLRLFENGQAA